MVLVSWDEIDISAIHYKVYLYTYNESGKINIIVMQWMIRILRDMMAIQTLG